MYAEVVDVGFGEDYGVQAEPFHCEECGYVESGCMQEECQKGHCLSWNYCRGKSIRKDGESHDGTEVENSTGQDAK
jgi:hypothetical protein